MDEKYSIIHTFRIRNFVVVDIHFSKVFKNLFLFDKSTIYDETEDRIIIDIIIYEKCLEMFYELRNNLKK